MIVRAQQELTHVYTKCILQPHAAPSTVPQGVTVDTQSSSFSWSPPPLIDQNGIITKYTVTITEVESGKRIKQFDVNSTVTSVALRDLIRIPCYTYTDFQLQCTQLNMDQQLHLI